MQSHALACSYISLHKLACRFKLARGYISLHAVKSFHSMHLHKLAFSYISLHAVT